MVSGPSLNREGRVSVFSKARRPIPYEMRLWHPWIVGRGAVMVAAYDVDLERASDELCYERDHGRP